MTIEKCGQTSCGHNPDNDSIPKGHQKDMLCAMCPCCAKCGCMPHFINTTCSECVKCETIPNHIRGNVGDGLAVGVDVTLKDEEVMLDLIEEKILEGDGR